MNNPSVHRVSRRQALGAALATGLAFTLRHLPRAQAATEAQPLAKPVPSTQERLPVIGLGTDKFRVDARDAVRAEIKRMVDLGGTVIDTAAAYGDSETIIGEAVAALGLRNRLFLATKLTGSHSARGGASGEASFNRSLERLRTEHVDLLQIHNLDGVDELMPTLQKWKQSGKIRYIGITTSRVAQHAQMTDYMRRYPLDFVQVDYSLANRDAAANVLPLALERKVAVLANIPFAFGMLFSQAQARTLPSWASDFDAASWGQFMLKYVISHPAVTCTIPGSTQVAHLEDNQAASRGRLPDAATRIKMEKFWDAG